MSKKTEAAPVAEAKDGEYIRLVKTETNMYSVETITITEGKITKVAASPPAYMPIAFDQMRRKTVENFVSVIS
jgi:hypothetical protein